MMQALTTMSAPVEPLVLGALVLNPASGAASWQGTPLALSATEFRLLMALVTQADAVVSKRTLMRTLWGHETPAAEAYLALYVRYLRQKLEADPQHPRVIRSEQGGYRFRTATQAVRPRQRWRIVPIRASASV